MKLRIQGNSLRLRISPSDMTRVISEGRLAHTIRFGPATGAFLTYALERSAAVSTLQVRYADNEVAILLPTTQAQAWAAGDEVGIYADLDSGAGTLNILLEKDFACLDRDDVENADTYPNPLSGARC